MTRSLRSASLESSEATERPINQWPRTAAHRPRPMPAMVGDALATTRASNDYAAASAALHNMRGLAIAFVLMLHSCVAYLGSIHASPHPFNLPPFDWQAFPIVDRNRWFGLDFFCAWLDVYLMCLMFFMSAVFTWPSLREKGIQTFLARRFVRLGLPLLFGVAVVMPVALYPAYRVTAASPALAEYARDYLNLPFLPNGPMWFLWQLLAFTLAAAALRRFAPKAVERMASASASFESRPGRAFLVWVLIAGVAYVPLALAYTPWLWLNRGPVAVQFSRPLLYAVYYCAGLGVGAYGLGRGMLRDGGVLTRNWRLWAASAPLTLVLWMGLTWLTFTKPTPLAFLVASDTSFALAGACNVGFALAFCLRFGGKRWPLVGRLSDHALGLYVVHYAFAVWQQYALLGWNWPAAAKASVVFLIVLTMSLTAVSAASAIRDWVLGHRLLSRLSLTERA